MPTLHWLTKETDLGKGKQIPFRILEKKKELSVANEEIASDSLPASPRNIIIQGDNLEALKAILPVYAGKVKCIYIDPPYNTGNAFEHYDDNIEHTLWLSMMYPRLELLREFLREDGSIFIHIDETEHAYLVVIMDEIFGRANFLGDLIWKKRKGGGNDSQFFALDHDYILVYAKNSSKDCHPNKWRVSQSNEYLKRYKEIDENGNRFYWDTVNRDGLQNPIPVELTCSDGSKLSVNSQLSEKSILDGIKNGNVRLKKVKEKWMLHHRVYLNPEGQVLRSILPEYATNKTAGEEQKSLNLHIDGFDYPKPEALIKVLLELATNENDIVLDSFLGSGTTAAVALKMNRLFIGIEMGDHAVTHVVPRLRKVIEGEQGGISESVGWKGGGSFDFYTLGKPVFGTDGKINPKIDYFTLAAFIWFIETGTSLSHQTIRKRGLIGTCNNTAYYLLFNGILGDKKPQNGNVLTSKVLQLLPAFEGKKVIYGESCLLGKDRLKDLQIIFKQIPYNLRGR